MLTAGVLNGMRSEKGLMAGVLNGILLVVVLRKGSKGKFVTLAGKKVHCFDSVSLKSFSG